MKALLRTGVLLLAVWLELSGVSFAKEVFLRDGSVLECESFWRRQGQIVVKVNRDVMLEFAPGEVDLRKTFPARAKAKGVKHKRPAVKQTVSAAAATSAPGSVPPAAPAASKPPVAAPPAAQPAAPAVAPAVPAVHKEVQPEPAAAAPEQGPLQKAEFERRAKENTERMAEAIKKKDPELIKKAMAAQQELVHQQRAVKTAGLKMVQGDAAPQPPRYQYLVLLAVCCLVTLVSVWVVFGKAGEAGWKCLVPFYNFYIMMRISGKPGWWFILLLIPVIGLAINLLAMLALAEKFDRSPAFGVGLLLLPMIFFPLLAFGGSQYRDAVPPPDMNFTFAEEP
ncbi:DUF5684 domain-containing protein [Geomonas limicola]|nr:DUF5684 domain-containing protein [Geomonas limicola]